MAARSPLRRRLLTENPQGKGLSNRAAIAARLAFRRPIGPAMGRCSRGRAELRVPNAAGRDVGTVRMRRPPGDQPPGKRRRRDTEAALLVIDEHRGQSIRTEPTARPSGLSETRTAPTNF